MTTPTRIEYRGPEGWIVWTDEDGVHLRAPRAGSLESPDVERLMRLIVEARAQRDTGIIPAPKPPTRAEIASMNSDLMAEFHAKRAAKTVYDALAPDTDTDTPPF